MFLKNPTDIIIYTDSFCYSACSGFIKAFQNTGGAIIVGFNGNPKIKGTKEFDGSQSPSSVHNFEHSQEYHELKNLGYNVIGITYSESFDDSYQNKEKVPIPREYAVDIVDRRVPIYGPYSDNNYELFIKNAHDIFEEFKTNCNKDNKKLILDDENCNYKLKEHERGGHPCGDDGKWDYSKCVAYYCDLGYYYDQYQKKCVLDKCSNKENEKHIYINNISPKEIQNYKVFPNDELVFHLHNDKYIYLFLAKEKNIFSTYNELNLKNCSNLFIKGNEFYYASNEPKSIFNNVVIVNYFRIVKEPTIITFFFIENKQNIVAQDNIDLNKGFVPFYMNIQGDKQLIYSFQSDKNKILYLPTFNKEVKMYYAEYNFDISPQEIININPNKFNQFSNEIITMKKNKQYIFNLKFPKDKVSGFFLFVRQNEMQQYKMIINDSYIYLSKQNFDYNLYFNYDLKSVYLKLSHLTPEAEIEIINNNNIINKNNKYFLFESDNKKLSLRLKNENPALIEFLYELKNVNILDTNKNRFYLINDFYHILKFRKSDNIETIKINLNSDNTLTAVLYANIGKGNYLGAIPKETIYDSKNIISEFNVPNDILDDDETFNILVKVKNNATLYVELNQGKGKGDLNGSLPLWLSVILKTLFIFGVLILFFVLIIIIYRCIKKRNFKTQIIEKRKFSDFFQLIEM